MFWIKMSCLRKVTTNVKFISDSFLSLKGSQILLIHTKNPPWTHRAACSKPSVHAWNIVRMCDAHARVLRYVSACANAQFIEQMLKKKLNAWERSIYWALESAQFIEHFPAMHPTELWQQHPIQLLPLLHLIQQQSGTQEVQFQFRLVSWTPNFGEI